MLEDTLWPLDLRVSSYPSRNFLKVTWTYIASDELDNNQLDSFLLQKINLNKQMNISEISDCLYYLVLATLSGIVVIFSKRLEWMFKPPKFSRPKNRYRPIPTWRIVHFSCCRIERLLLKRGECQCLVLCTNMHNTAKLEMCHILYIHKTSALCSLSTNKQEIQLFIIYICSMNSIKIHNSSERFR